MKVKDVNDVNENWQTMVPCLQRIGASRSGHLFVAHNRTFHDIKKVIYGPSIGIFTFDLNPF